VLIHKICTATYKNKPANTLQQSIANGKEVYADFVCNAKLQAKEVVRVFRRITLTGFKKQKN
jgi:hypothetical protein